MPRSLKLYIATVVAGSALALLVTTLNFPVEPEIALGDFLPLPISMWLGTAFWLALTLAASALPLRHRGSAGFQSWVRCS